jgi:hypothetical protein
MLVSTLTTLALRCPGCGKMDFYAVSRFNFSGNTNVKVLCECGTTLINIAKKSRNIYCLQIECVMCETKHLITLKAGELWNQKVHTVTCEGTGVEIGFIGTKELVIKSVKNLDRSIREMAEDLGYDKYFLNSDVMFQALELLRTMAEEGRMSCSCGGALLEVDVFPDRIELSCSSCDAVGIVFAETVKDLQWIQNMEGIRLEAHSYRYLDDKRLKKRRRVRK